MADALQSNHAHPEPHEPAWELPGPLMPSAYASAATVRVAATQAIEDWGKRWYCGEGFVDHLFIDRPNFRQHFVELRRLMRAVWWAGLEEWILTVLGVPLRIRSHAELIEWCRLQQECIRRFPKKVYVAWNRDFDKFTVGAEDIIRFATPLLDCKDADWDAWLATLQLLRFDWKKPDLPIHVRHPFGTPVKMAWEYMRGLPGRNRPSEPKQVSSRRMARRALDDVVRWCEAEIQKEQHQTADETMPLEAQATRDAVDRKDGDKRTGASAVATGSSETSEIGVSLRDVALLLNDNDPAATSATVKKWVDSGKLKAPIGKCPLDGRAKLYRLSEILLDVGKLESLNSDDQKRLREYLTPKLRVPRAN